MAVIADMEAIVVMAGRRGGFVLVVMRVAVMVVRMAVMDVRDRANLRHPERLGDRRTEAQHCERKQADQHGPDGRDSVRHHSQPYKWLDKAK